jgi:hypothetical protein
LLAGVVELVKALPVLLRKLAAVLVVIVAL